MSENQSSEHIDVEAVAALIRKAEADYELAKRKVGRVDGFTWAKRAAPSEIRTVLGWRGALTIRLEDAPESLVSQLEEAESQFLGSRWIAFDDNQAHWAGFIEEVEAVWHKVAPFLDKQ